MGEMACKAYLANNFKIVSSISIDGLMPPHCLLVGKIRISIQRELCNADAATSMCKPSVGSGTIRTRGACHNASITKETHSNHIERDECVCLRCFASKDRMCA